MSISVTQEESKFRPVTIVINDERTLNMLRFAIQEFYYNMQADKLINDVWMIDNEIQYGVAKAELSELLSNLEKICYNN